MAETLQPVPYDQPIAGTMLCDDSWLTWFRIQWTLLGQTARRLVAVALTDQAAAIGTTAIPTGSLKGGSYRISYYVRITRPATTSSALTVSLGWTDGGIACSLSGAALVGNTTATVQSGSIIVDADAAASLKYSTTYASVGVQGMQYKLKVIVEQL